MRVSRIFLDQGIDARAALSVQGAPAHYLANVLRLGPGAALIIFNGNGLEYPATITEAGKKQLVLAVGDASAPRRESPLRTHLGLGISRGERMDYAIQKATELGVTSIAPLFTEHCEVKLQGERQDKRQAHWRQVAISACEQSGRAVVPDVLPPQSLADWVRSLDCPVKLLFDQRQDRDPASLPKPDEVALLIGPEGGFADSEIALARELGFSGIRLGARVLRTETAPVAALAVLQYLWGDFGAERKD